MSLFRSVMSALLKRRSRHLLDKLEPRLKPENKIEEPAPEPKLEDKPAPKPRFRPHPRLWAGLMPPFPRYGKKDEE